MSEFTGVTGQIARVDLSSEKITVESPSVDVYQNFLGGAGLGLYYLFKEGIVSPNIDPLSPQNLFQVLIGPVNGVAPNCRSTVVTKSPFGCICISLAGGQTGAQLRFAGWDGIQITGKASSPVYLSVVDDNIEIRDATDLWGKTTDEAELELKSQVLAPIEQTDKSKVTADQMTPQWANLQPPTTQGIGAKRLAGVWVIGPAGENQVWNSTLQTEASRAHGRYGAGAVMGSKNLKAIVVRGTKGQNLADKATFMSTISKIHASEMTEYFWRSYGTAGIGYNYGETLDCFPIRNWQWESWSDPHGVTALTGPFFDRSSYVRRSACPNCFLMCNADTTITSSDSLLNGGITDMPDWEAIGMVGGNLGYVELPGKTPEDPYEGTIEDLNETHAKNQYTAMMFDKYGMDYIEGGAMLAYLMELNQRGYISASDLDGINLTWGDVHAVDTILTKIVNNDGIGATLAKGLFYVADYFAQQKGKPEIATYAIGCHGYAQPAHGVRSNKNKSPLEYMTVIRPCEHTGGGGGSFLTRDLKSAITGQNSVSAVNSMVYCLFAQGDWGNDGSVAMIKAATGWTNFDVNALLDVGARIYALGRLFNLTSLNVTPQDYDKYYPPRWFEPLPNGPYKGKATVYDGDPSKMYADLQQYYQDRGWTNEGVPTQATLQNLGLSDLAGDIAKKLGG
jgi:aldehyde:ferredoxin oxidoreductase